MSGGDGGLSVARYWLMICTHCARAAASGSPPPELLPLLPPLELPELLPLLLPEPPPLLLPELLLPELLPEPPPLLLPLELLPLLELPLLELPLLPPLELLPLLLPEPLPPELLGPPPSADSHGSGCAESLHATPTTIAAETHAVTTHRMAHAPMEPSVRIVLPRPFRADHTNRTSVRANTAPAARDAATLRRTFRAPAERGKYR
jgi:hypothetical protein